ncbi:uncharacterized protein LOC106179153 [Lingula anatina]|uniref:Uncharacterized protein LOC106179153 n=1 Tax=Lingula anatina TaxID=7574 RepID=A0A1S3K6T2_LINAN|nr:uncharacterized protein LOC106179153 [Lingula anatina]|eukprot:XP_013418139.1 uncharacterized protein LOC106179153 [Lingula anatina]
MRKFVQHTGSATDTRNMPHAAVTVLVFVLCIYSAKAAPVDDILPEDAAVNSNTSPWSTTSGDTDYRISVTTDEDRNEDTNTSSLTLQYAKQMAKVLVSVLQHLEKEKSTGLAKRSHKKSQLLPNPFDRMRRGRHQMMSFMPGIIVPGSERYGRYRVNRGVRRMSNDLLSAKIHALISYYFDSVGRELNKERHLYSRFTG